MEVTYEEIELSKHFSPIKAVEDGVNTEGLETTHAHLGQISEVMFGYFHFLWCQSSKLLMSRRSCSFNVMHTVFGINPGSRLSSILNISGNSLNKKSKGPDCYQS